MNINPHSGVSSTHQILGLLFTFFPGGGGSYEALLAGSYDQYVRNQQAAPEWQDAPDQMEQVGRTVLLVV